MKKITCSKTTIHVSIFFLLFLFIQSIFGVVFDFKILEGRGKWVDPSLTRSITLLVIVFFIIWFSKKYCILPKDEIIYKCLSCGEVFDKSKVDNDLKCPHCKGDIMNIEQYYG